MQTKFMSFVESCANIVVGFTINFFAQIMVFPIFGLHATLGSQFGIGAIFTVISLVRQYILRRWFNGRLVKFHQGITVREQLYRH
jgi:hypothetical protein